MADDLVIPRLTAALNTYNWAECQKICNDLIAALDLATEPYPASSAKTILSALRRKRQFAQMACVADAFIRTGQTSALVTRLYAQAMIDQGNLAAPMEMLKSILADPLVGEDEKAEAKGLLGRIFKQLYVNAKSPSNPRQQSNLRQALGFYNDVYKTNPQSYLWHGINTVALLARAEKDKVPIDGFVSYNTIALQISDSLNKLPSLQSWDLATAAENAIALGNWDAADKYILQYLLDPAVDAFEIASCLRQLTEVWGLSEDNEPGRFIVATLKAGLLKSEGGCLNVAPGSLTAQTQDAKEANSKLEKVFGAEKYAPLIWYKTGLLRCSAVGRIETVMGQRVGTGFLVKAADFFEGRDAKELLLLTNAHVISPTETPFPGAIPPDVAQVVFEADGTTCKVTGLLWSSPPGELDATLLTLDLAQGPTPCPLTPPPAAFDSTKQQRVYVIGYPMGGGLSISLQDSIWLAANDKFLHYRTPTDPGSSGSPVFDQDYWTVVAIHHKGDSNMPRIDGQPGTYAANEGTSLVAIQKAIKAASQKVAAATP